MIFTFDLEVENHRHNKRLASPFYTENYIVQIGWSVDGNEPSESYYTENHRDCVLPAHILSKMGEGDIINGFNVKFDLLWVWTEPCLVAALKRGVRIYDGQYVEYLMGGMTQDVQMVSMNDIATKYGGGTKVDAVKEMWEDGLLTSQIPRNLLTDYLIGDGDQIVGDVHNTWLILAGQIADMRKRFGKKFRTMIKHRMDGLLATIEMEHNGMYVDKDVGENLRTGLVTDLARYKIELETFLPELPDELTFNWGSPKMKSCLIFGGTTKYQKWMPHLVDGAVTYAKKTVLHPVFMIGKRKYVVPPDDCILAGELYVLPVPKGTEGAFKHEDKYYVPQATFKSGKNKGQAKSQQAQEANLEKPKGALTDHFFTFKGYTKPHVAWMGDTTDAFNQPIYSCSADVISKIATRGLPFTTALATFTSKNKDLGTYYWTEDKSGRKKGMLTLVNDQGIIHHKLNHTSTVTSRMSSSDPNLQTLPRAGTSEVKKMFVSRFGDEGLVAEIDYSQLEVVIQGVLSKDPQLCEDLNNKIDFHCKRLASKLGEDYDEVWRKHHIDHDTTYGNMRTKAKEFSFQRAYGAGVDAIVTSTGMSKADVEALIAAENRLYPRVAEFDKRLETAIIANRVSTDRKLFLDGAAFSQGESHWDSPTGTRYKWREGITPQFLHAKGKYTGFSPTERKNYPVQGFGGEVVQTMLGKVFRYILQQDRFAGDVLLVNTVHDCVILDGKKGKIEVVAKAIQAILESVPAVFNEAFPDININVPFPCETEIGTDLYTMREI
jgi:DNA polymerase-1